MFGKVEALVKKIPCLFYSRVANKFYSQRQNIRFTQQGGSATLKKKKKVWFSLHITFASLYSFALFMAEEGFTHCYIQRYPSEFDTEAKYIF